MIILTHRGLEPSNLLAYPESSYKTFKDQINRGFGIEFDCNFAKDGIFVFHDFSLERISNGKDKREFKELNISEIKKIKLHNKSKFGRIAEIYEILNLIEMGRSTLNALHLKGKFQNKENVNRLISALKEHPLASKKILIFDIKPEIAQYVKLKFPEIKLAASVAKEFDIKRYGNLVYNTLLPLNEIIKLRKIYDWVWLDEWDTVSEHGKEELLNTSETFNILRKFGFNIALVTPELHGTSPSLYGGEFHKHAKDNQVLFKRIKELLKLNPDAICTDYPEEVKKLQILSNNT